MKINLENIKSKLSRNSLGEALFVFLEKRNRSIIFLCFFVMLVGCVFLWYSFVYNHHWTKEREQEYIRSKEKETVFKKEKFNDIISEKSTRDSGYQEKIENITDIFRIRDID